MHDGENQMDKNPMEQGDPSAARQFEDRVPASFNIHNSNFLRWYLWTFSDLERMT